MQTEIAALVQLLRQGTASQQADAASALARLAESGGAERCEAIAAAGAVAPLVQLLSSGSVLELQKVLAALACLSAGSASVRAAVAAEGGVEALVPLLRSGNAFTQALAAEALMGLAMGNEEHCTMRIAAANAIPDLVQLCSSGTELQQVTAAGALANLCSAAASADAIAAAGGIPALVGILPSHTASRSASILAHVRASAALSNLTAAVPQARAAIVAAGAPAAVIRAAQSSPFGSEMRWAAARALHNIMLDRQPATCAAVVAAGGIAVLAGQLAHISGSAAHAAAALGILAAGSVERCGAIVSAGCVPRLVRLLRAQADEAAQSEAARALANLIASGGPGAAAVFHAACGFAAAAALLSCQHCGILEHATNLMRNLAVTGALGPQQAAAALPLLGPLCYSPDEAVKQTARAAQHSVTQRLAGSSSAAAALGHSVPASQPANQQQQPQQPVRPPRICAAPGCGATTNLRRCGGCGTVRYCSEACSKAHWRAHKAECRRLQAERAAAAAAQGSN